MPSTTASFAFDVCLLFVSIFAIFRLVSLRSKHKFDIRNNKSGTANYKFLSRALSARTLVIIAVITLLIIAKTIFDIQSVVHIHGEAALGHLLFMTAFVGGIFLAVFYTVNNMLKGPEANQQDKDK